MKRRVTFVHGADDAFDPEQLRLENDILQLQSLKAAREDQWTFSFSELPQEVCAYHPSNCTADPPIAMASIEAMP